MSSGALERPGLPAFCEANALTEATVTTRTLRATATVRGVTIQFIPVAVYCYAAGRHRVERWGDGVAARPFFLS
jgi:hypothetical protein